MNLNALNRDLHKRPGVATVWWTVTLLGWWERTMPKSRGRYPLDYRQRIVALR
jgi:hypothetical protein